MADTEGGVGRPPKGVPSIDGVPLKEYIEAILDEQRRGMLVAEQEREKAAKALRIELSRAIEEGDRALRDHIHAQIEQIRGMIESSDKLELARIDTLAARLTEQFSASEKAIAKAETAAEKRFDSVNEFREQLADQASRFLLKEVADAELREVRKQLEETKGLAQSARDQRLGKREAEEGMSRQTGLLIAAAGAAFAFLTIIISVVLAANGTI